jgi:hypothetical protein
MAPRGEPYGIAYAPEVIVMDLEPMEVLVIGFAVFSFLALSFVLLLVVL